MIEHFLYCNKNLTAHFCVWNSNWDINNFFFPTSIVVISKVKSIDTFSNWQWKGVLYSSISGYLYHQLLQKIIFLPVGACTSNLNHQFLPSSQIKSQNLNWFKLALFFWILEHFGYFHGIQGIVPINLQTGLQDFLLCCNPFPSFHDSLKVFLSTPLHIVGSIVWLRRL